MEVKKSIRFTPEEVEELLLRKASSLLGEPQETLSIRTYRNGPVTISTKYTPDEIPRD